MSPKQLPPKHQLIAVGNENIQVVGSNNVIQRITNIFQGDTEAQRALRNRRAMLELVKNTWIKGVLEKSLYNEVLIELGMEEHPDAVSHPWDMQVQMPDMPNRILPADVSMLEVFDEMNDAMLILGEPGSGKTTMLLELARDCILRAEWNENQPIPVIFNLSSWNGRQTIDNWLVDELRTKYNVPKKTAQNWVTNDDLLLLLDGLDEVKLENRERCVKAINEFRQEHGLTMPLAVCSRIADYEALTVKLNLTGAVLLQSLTSEQVEGYFEQIGPELEDVHRILKNDEALREMARRPLILSILTLAYQGTSTKEFIGEGVGTLEARRSLLFNTYIQRMLKRVARTKSERYTSSEIKQWLAWLARKMISQEKSIFMLEELDAKWLDATGQRRMFGLNIGVILGLFIALTVGTILGRFVVLSLNLKIGYFIGAGLGLIVGLVCGFRSSSGRTERQIERLNWSWKKAGRGLLAGLALAVIFGPGLLCLVSVVWVTTGKSFLETILISLPGWVLMMLLYFPFLVVVGGLSGLFLGLERSNLDNKTFPNQGVKQSLRNSLTVALLGGLILGLLGGLIYGLIASTLFKDTDVFIVGVSLGATSSAIIALFLWLFFGGYVVCVHYVIRASLFRRGHIPWNYVHFLNYATDRIFLRRVGGGYIFVHRLLMEHFADLYPEI